MYVRWKRRRVGAARRGEAGDALDAVLVAAVQVGGLPRQRFVQHLGRIHERDLGDPDARRRFWRELRLGWLYVVDGYPWRVDEETRARLEAAIAARVPKPPVE